MTNYLITPQDLVFIATSRIKGFKEMVAEEDIPQWHLLDTAEDIATEWAEDWDEDQGFGSSDRTFMVKEFIDSIILDSTDGSYKTDFTPSLSVIKE